MLSSNDILSDECQIERWHIIRCHSGHVISCQSRMCHIMTCCSSDVTGCQAIRCQIISKEKPCERCQIMSVQIMSVKEMLYDVATYDLFMKLGVRLCFEELFWSVSELVTSISIWVASKMLASLTSQLFSLRWHCCCTLKLAWQLFFVCGTKRIMGDPNLIIRLL